MATFAAIEIAPEKITLVADGEQVEFLAADFIDANAAEREIAAVLGVYRNKVQIEMLNGEFVSVEVGN